MVLNNKGHVNLLRRRKGNVGFIMVFFGLIITLPIYLAVAWPEYIFYLITGKSIMIINFLSEYVFTDRSNENYMFYAPVTGIAIWVFIWFLVFTVGRKIYEKKK